MDTWKDRRITTRIRVGAGLAAAYAARCMTREHTIGVRRDLHPQCEFCSHVTERTFEVTEKTHNVELPESSKGVAFACVACWSRLSLANPDQYED